MSINTNFSEQLNENNHGTFLVPSLLQKMGFIAAYGQQVDSS